MATKNQAATSTLFSGNVSFPVGFNESNAFNVSGKKQQGLPLDLMIQVESAAFPAGRTTLTIFFSFDGGLTFPASASMGVDGPIQPGPKVPLFQDMTYSRGADDVPTHAKYASDAPSAFTAQVIVSAG